MRFFPHLCEKKNLSSKAWGGQVLIKVIQNVALVFFGIWGLVALIQVKRLKMKPSLRKKIVELSFREVSSRDFTRSS